MNVSVASSPHFSNMKQGTRQMMVDVILALIPTIAVSVWIFGWYSILHIGICVLTCSLTELVWKKLAGMPASVSDASGPLTGVILALSLPWSAPIYVSVLGSIFAIAIGKMIFGGLGMNLFNPAMVGRAFVILSFAGALGASAYVYDGAPADALTQATPLTVARDVATAQEFPGLWPLLIGKTNGSLGETSSLAILLGGIFLCVRRTAAWQIPTGVVLGAVIPAAFFELLGFTAITAFDHLFAGSLLFGAFFIATDPVSSPITPKGKWIFGVGIGILIMILRTFSSYPEGVMFAVLLMNSVVPLLNRWTIPTPVGGSFPEKPNA